MQIDPRILNNEERIGCALRSLYRRFGYCPYKMSKFEEYALYVRNKDFLASDGIISFTDTNGRLLALKPDVTLSIINNSKDLPGQVQKLYYDENVYRISKSSRSYKEIKQTGLECMGDVGLFELCEVLMLAIRSLESISPDYIFEISHVGLLEAVFAGLTLEEKVKKQLLSCINRKNADELDRLCSEGALTAEFRETLSVFMKNYASIDAALEALNAVCTAPAAAGQLEEFARMLRFVEEMGYAANTRVDFSLTNDMGYYSGVAFRGYIQGIPTGVLSGGQYDKIMRKMGRSASAVGFAVYLDALERFDRPRKEYDADILLLHGGDMVQAMKAAEALSGDGSSVRISAQVPEGLRFRQIIRLAGKGADNETT